MNKKIKIYLICFSLISLTYLFLFPLPHLFGYNPLSLLKGYQNKITFSEPAIMLLLGSGLIAMGIFARKSFGKKTKILEFKENKAREKRAGVNLLIAPAFIMVKDLAKSQKRSLTHLLLHFFSLRSRCDMPTLFVYIHSNKNFLASDQNLFVLNLSLHC
jgi:hypothetical protein